MYPDDTKKILFRIRYGLFKTVFTVWKNTHIRVIAFNYLVCNRLLQNFLLKRKTVRDVWEIRVLGRGVQLATDPWMFLVKAFIINWCLIPCDCPMIGRTALIINKSEVRELWVGGKGWHSEGKTIMVLIVENLLSNWWISI